MRYENVEKFMYHAQYKRNKILKILRSTCVFQGTVGRWSQNSFVIILYSTQIGIKNTITFFGVISEVLRD